MPAAPPLPLATGLRLSLRAARCGQAALTGLIRSVEGRVGERQTERREREGGAAVSGVASVAAEVARKAAGCVAWAAAAPSLRRGEVRGCFLPSPL